EAASKGLTITLLEKAIQRLPDVALLNVQYRMHNSIMAFSNRKFYKDELTAHDAVANRALAHSLPLEFIDTAGCGFEEQAGEDGESRSNPEEISILRKHFDQLKDEVPERWNAAIISPYRAQVELLQREFAGVEDVAVNTIDSFQGQERDVVYISLVRSNEKGEIGFLRDYRRMNVAMTRARKKLVIIGDSATLGNDRFFGEFLEYVESIAGYRTAWEFMY
ncbi:MAG: ATP-binding protein, partial [Flavobacteriales bacterium]